MIDNVLGPDPREEYCVDCECRPAVHGLLCRRCWMDGARDLDDDDDYSEPFNLDGDA